MNVLKRDPKKKVATNKIKFKYSSLRDVVGEEKKKEKSNTTSKWKQMWENGDTKQYEKRVNYRPQADFRVAIDEQLGVDVYGDQSDNG